LIENDLNQIIEDVENNEDGEVSEISVRLRPFAKFATNPVQNDFFGKNKFILK
jgi:hypothetical protein